MSKTYLGIDPGGRGGHTGIVLIKAGETHARVVDSWAVRGQLEGFREWSLENEHLYQVDKVVVEQFVDMQVLGADRSPLLIEGAVRFVRPDAVLSPASGYKKAVPDSVLKKFDMWFTGDHHADRRSAARHVLRYLRSFHRPTQEFGWGHIRKGNK